MKLGFVFQTTSLCYGPMTTLAIFDVFHLQTRLSDLEERAFIIMLITLEVRGIINGLILFSSRRLGNKCIWRGRDRRIECGFLMLGI